MKRWFEGDAVKYVVIAIAIVGVLLYVVVNYSVAEDKIISCRGSFYDNDKPLQKQEIYFKFIKYRWWVQLWRDGGGPVYVMEDSGRRDVIHRTKTDGLYEYTDFGDKGSYTNMGKTMRYIRGDMLFLGKCKDQD